MAVEIEFTEVQIEAEIEAERAAIRQTLFGGLGAAAGSIWLELDQDFLARCAFGRKARGLLKCLGITTGKMSNDQVAMVLAAASGKPTWVRQNHPNVKRVTSSLLMAALRELQASGGWPEAEVELNRRRKLCGIHRLVWRGRDAGWLSIPGDRTTRDPEPRYL